MKEINLQKKELRTLYKEKRASLTGSVKREYDERILHNLLSLPLYSVCETLLIYFSVSSEVDTVNIINSSLTLGKKVALPLCEQNGVMDFYAVDNLDTLKEDRYGIPSPQKDETKLVVPDKKTLIIVPGLSFDKNGFRLGYGGGYYDRYLERYQISSVGLCYDFLISPSLPTDCYDKKTDFTITECNIYDNRKEA